MSKHSRGRQSKTNSWISSTFEEKPNMQPCGRKSELILDKQNENITDKKQNLTENHEKNVENKVVKKPPRHKSSLFPFPWKNRKRQNQPTKTTEQQAKPMKAKESRSPTVTNSKRDDHDSRISIKQVVEDKWTLIKPSSFEDSTGFKKLKVCKHYYLLAQLQNTCQIYARPTLHVPLI